MKSESKIKSGSKDNAGNVSVIVLLTCSLSPWYTAPVSRHRIDLNRAGSALAYRRRMCLVEIPREHVPTRRRRDPLCGILGPIHNRYETHPSISASQIPPSSPPPG